MAYGQDRRYMTRAQAEAAQIDVGLRQYMLQVYNYMASGLALKSERSNIEDTDVTEATPRMNAAILTLEAAQASFVRINRQTLFDLLG